MASQLIFLPMSGPQAQPDGYETPSLPPSTWMVCPLAQLETADNLLGPFPYIFRLWAQHKRFDPDSLDNALWRFWRGAVGAAGMLAIIGCFGFVGTILSEWLSDQYDNRWLLFLFYGQRVVTLQLLFSFPLCRALRN